MKLKIKLENKKNLIIQISKLKKKEIEKEKERHHKKVIQIILLKLMSLNKIMMVRLMK